jgi:hypothetical protein
LISCAWVLPSRLILFDLTFSLDFIWIHLFKGKPYDGGKLFGIPKTERVGHMQGSRISFSFSLYQSHFSMLKLNDPSNDTVPRASFRASLRIWPSSDDNGLYFHACPLTYFMGNLWVLFSAYLVSSLSIQEQIIEMGEPWPSKVTVCKWTWMLKKPGSPGTWGAEVSRSVDAHLRQMFSCLKKVDR